ncbi:MAG: hypothetical protein NC344_11455 [Bacteroidales bacterium]|nr:hypothetical protein [Bacteroidales bacterium]MCM1148422.1 hypothetical protein [Bacteroidales bacterium]MCM1207050.1 hypothetical protein [Bacillota bacterium]MCM1510792.1 hypothetical protein [Clostridium sp.]
MKEKFITLIALLTICLSGKAQTSISLKQLNGTTWQQIYPDPEDNTTIIKFSASTFTQTIEHPRLKSRSAHEFKYYLNNNIPTVFDFASVGKKDNGTYIIKYNYETGRVMSYKVPSITNSTLKLHYLPIPGTIIGNKNGTDIIYKRVK